ncbi:MAG: hypothetical protein NC048_03875 [Bacteroides sp.]|nr:hypothetical protein [Ruminococcus flavefaciens]MCM1554613.1 hypothetical protein [Bacteroides sp.]
MSWFGNIFRKKPQTAFVDLSGKAVSDAEYNRIKRQQEAYAMQLLQKVGEHGKEGLNKDERAFLEAYSRSSYLN